MIVNTSFLVREIRRNEQHDSFINAVTHELKTPIASIRLYLQTLQRRDVDEAQRHEFYRLMLDDTDRLMGTVEQVLKAGEAEPQQAGPARAGGLQRSGSGVRGSGAHQPSPSARIPALRAIGQQRRRRQTYWAIPKSCGRQFPMCSTMPSSIPESAWRFRCASTLRTKNRLTLSVHDQGVGIPAGELKRIFKRFYRVSNRSLSHVKGTGLGLFIVRAIVRKHGGRVFAESEGEGRGTTVVLELPRVNCRRSHRPPLDFKFEIKSGGRERVPTIRMSHVLIVEDEAHLAKGLQFNLEAEGHSVAVVGDGERALDLLLGKSAESRPPISMPSCSTSCFPARTVSPWPRNCAPPNNLFPCSC